MSRKSRWLFSSTQNLKERRKAANEQARQEPHQTAEDFPSEKEAEELGLDFFSTPFDPTSVDFLESIDRRNSSDIRGDICGKKPKTKDIDGSGSDSRIDIDGCSLIGVICGIGEAFVRT